MISTVINTQEQEDEKQFRHLIFKDIVADVLEWGVRYYIESGVHMGYYLSIEDGINALYRKSKYFYPWLIENEMYNEAGLIKKQIEEIENENNPN